MATEAVSKSELLDDLPKITLKMDEEPKKEIDLLDLPGVGAATAEKLKESGYESVMSIAVASPGQLIEASGISEAASRKMINAARNSLSMGFQSGEDLLKKREQVR